MESTVADERCVRRDLSTAASVFGVLVFLASDLMLFAGFFAAYFLLRGQAGTWPPEGVTIDTTAAALGTVVLLLSSVTVHQATRAHGRGDVQRCRQWLATTAMLGALFALNQLRDYRTVDFGPSDHAYGGIYWTLTGLHGLHVVVGVSLISLLAWRMVVLPAGNDAAMEATAYFWHLVDAVWVALFVVIWILR